MEKELIANREYGRGIDTGLALKARCMAASVNRPENRYHPRGTNSKLSLLIDSELVGCKVLLESSHPW